MRHFSLVFVSTILLASQGCNPTSPLGPGAPTMVRSAADCKDLFVKLDTNGDGILSETEYLAGRAFVPAAFPALVGATDAMLSAHLKGFDANPDGMVTPDEFGRGCVGTASPDPRPSPAPTATACDCPQLVSLDGDKNGTVSFEEFFLGRGGNQDAKDRLNIAFTVLDLNGDGQLTAAEICGPVTGPSPSAKPTDPPRPSPSVKPTDSPSPSPSGSVKPTDSPSPSPSASVKPTDSPSPSTSPSPSPKPTDDCGAKFATFDANGNGSVDDEEYFNALGGTQANKYQISADFKTLDTNGDGVLSPSELCNPPWPRTMTVSIYNPMTPFGPQTVDIASGGTVTFSNVNSGVPWTIDSLNSPSFPDVPLATSPSTATTIPLITPGDYEYVITGTNPFVVHGHIIVH